jgi:hypothetical protein
MLPDVYKLKLPQSPSKDSGEVHSHAFTSQPGTSPIGPNSTYLDYLRGHQDAGAVVAILFSSRIIYWIDDETQSLNQRLTCLAILARVHKSWCSECILREAQMLRCQVPHPQFAQNIANYFTSVTLLGGLRHLDLAQVRLTETDMDTLATHVQGTLVHLVLEQCEIDFSFGCIAFAKWIKSNSKSLRALRLLDMRPCAQQGPCPIDPINLMKWTRYCPQLEILEIRKLECVYPEEALSSSVSSLISDAFRFSKPYERQVFTEVTNTETILAIASNCPSLRSLCIDVPDAIPFDLADIVAAIYLLRKLNHIDLGSSPIRVPAASTRPASGTRSNHAALERISPVMHYIETLGLLFPNLEVAPIDPEKIIVNSQSPNSGSPDSSSPLEQKFAERWKSWIREKKIL